MANINNIIFSVLYLITLGSFIYLFIKYIMPYLNKKNENKEKEIKNKKYELFKDLDPDIMKESIDKYFKSEVNRYIAYKFIANKSMYIKTDEINEMIKDVTKLIYIEISELYVFYIKMTRSIDNDDDLLEYIHNRVQNICIEAVSNFNSTMIN